jgi:hypothetical protein
MLPPSPCAALAAPRSERHSANIDGPRAADRAAHGARGERRGDHGLAAGNQLRAGGRHDVILDRAREQRQVAREARAHERRDVRRVAHEVAQRHGLGQRRASVARVHLTAWRHDRHGELARHRQPHDVEGIERAHEHEPAEQRGRDVVGVAARHGGFGLEARSDQLGLP